VNVADVTPQQKTITLESGRVLHLTDLSLLDFRDGERILKRGHDKWLPTPAQVDTWPHSFLEALGVLLWLLARKHGVSKADQIAGKWPFSLDELLVDASDVDIVEHKDLIAAFYAGRRAKKSSGSSPAPSEPDSPTTTS
jgi:hypothetical protein